jgi:DNA-binding response OmpR family regulator
MKILFIDEEKPFVDIYRDVFQKNGYEFITTFDIQKVLDLTELERPDVVLLDIVIPKPDNVIAEQGYSYLEKVKSNPKTKNIPVIVFSNLDSPEDRKKYKEFGAAAFMFKRDCTSKEVLEVVDQIIKKSKK